MTLLWILLASLLVSVVSFVGVLTLLAKKKFREEDYISSLVSFAAGIMLSAAFFDILPEALELNPEPSLFLAIFAGMIVFFFLERFVLWFHHHDESHGAHPTSVLVLVGDGFHNFIDGIAIAAAFLASPAIGVAATLAIAAHEIPQEIADFSILVHGGMVKRKAILWNFLSGITAVAGAVLGYFFIHQLEQYLWVFLAFAGGMFLYIASSDLIPELHRDFRIARRWKQTIPFVAGIVILWCLTRLIVE